MPSIPALSSDVANVAPPPRPLLDVQNLRVHFLTGAGAVRAVDGIDYEVGSQETLGLVGESGSGKTMSSLALLRLVPRPARVVGGRVLFEGHDLWRCRSRR